MTKATVYPKAPVVEAVIDIQVALGADVGECLTSLAGDLSAEFPEKAEIQVMAMEVGPAGSSMKSGPIGWRLQNRDNDRILQLRRQGFTYSHMSPYTEWPIFSSEARAMWDRFVRSCNPQSITRVAVRYINRLKLPPGQFALEDFLSIYPMLPDEYQPMTGVLMQLQGLHKDVDRSCMSRVILASEPSSNNKFQSFLLDIDVFVERQIASGDDCWALLERLRHKKNDLFESAITEKLRETFK